MITWDENKRQRNIVKHGIDFIGAEAIFDEFMFTREDNRESYGEIRFSAIGIKEGRVVTLIYTERNDQVRIISIRKATKNETEYYFQNCNY
jgi:hypothetical protein